MYQAPIPVKRALAHHCHHNDVAVGTNGIRENLDRLYERKILRVFDAHTLYSTKKTRDGRVWRKSSSRSKIN